MYTGWEKEMSIRLTIKEKQINDVEEGKFSLRSDWKSRMLFLEQFKRKYPEISMKNSHNWPGSECFGWSPLVNMDPYMLANGGASGVIRSGSVRTTEFIFQSEECLNEFLTFEKYDEPDTLEILNEGNRSVTHDIEYT